MRRIVQHWDLAPHYESPQTIRLPGGAEILAVGLHDGVPNLVVLLDPVKPPEDRVFYLCPAGCEVPATGRWLGLAGRHTDGRSLHVFEVPRA